MTNKPNEFAGSFRKWGVTLFSGLVLIGLGSTARLWVPWLLEFAHAKKETVESIKSLLELGALLVGWACAAIIFFVNLWKGKKEPVEPLPASTVQSQQAGRDIIRAEGNVQIGGLSVASQRDVIVSGDIVQKKIEIHHAALPSLASLHHLPPAPHFRPDPRPGEIMERIRNTPPFNQEQIMESFQGLPVCWPLRLGGVSGVKGSPDLRTLTLFSGGGNQVISCNVSIIEYPRLKIAALNDVLEVRGFIENIRMGGLGVTLKEVRVSFSATGIGEQVNSEELSREISEISFKFAPPNIFFNGWKPVDPSGSVSLKFSVPPDYEGGLAWEASQNDAVDYEAEMYQRVSNRLRFVAKLAHGAHVYAKIQLGSKVDHAASKFGWIACGIGDRPPQKERGDEWTIFRVPQTGGWTTFDLFLPDEVSRTFGQAEGLEFIELLAIRLRGSLSVSPIKLFWDPSSMLAAERP